MATGYRVRRARRGDRAPLTDFSQRRHGPATAIPSTRDSNDEGCEPSGLHQRVGDHDPEET
jgi:hypothetical protein